MKSLVRNTLLHALSLLLLDSMFSGVTVLGGWTTFIIGGFIFWIMTLILRPVVNIITLPARIVSFGLLSFISNAVLLYILTIILTDISIRAFTFSGFHFLGFVIPKVYLNTFFAYVFCAFVFSLFESFYEWLIS